MIYMMQKHYGTNGVTGEAGDLFYQLTVGLINFKSK